MSIPLQAPSTHVESEPIVSLQPDMAGKILWSPPFDEPKNPGSLPDGQPPSINAITTPIFPLSLSFPDGILSEIQATASCAFSRTVQMASVHAHNSPSSGDDTLKAMSIPQPIISLYYPHDGCHDIIDAMVKSVAGKEGADVVVLDSLELALGEFGAFGKEVAHAIDELYKVPTPDENPEKDRDKDRLDDKIQMVFNNIVDIQRETDSIDESSSQIFERQKSRIIYMRDFGSMAAAALPLLPYLLQALHVRRTAKFDGALPDCENALQPTLLILGFARTPEYDQSSWYPEDRVARISWWFAQSGAALAKNLPWLDGTLSGLPNKTFPASPFSSTYFLSSLITNHRELTTIKLTSASNPIYYLMSTAVTLSVFPKDSHTKDFRQVEQHIACSRRQAVLNGWMMVCLRCRGAIVSENPLDLIQMDDNQTSTADKDHNEACSADPLGIPKPVTLPWEGPPNSVQQDDIQTSTSGEEQGTSPPEDVSKPVSHLGDNPVASMQEDDMQTSTASDEHSASTPDSVQTLIAGEEHNDNPPDISKPASYLGKNLPDSTQQDDIKTLTTGREHISSPPDIPKPIASLEENSLDPAPGDDVQTSVACEDHIPNPPDVPKPIDSLEENVSDSLNGDDVQKSITDEENSANSPDVPKCITLLDDMHKTTGILIPVALDGIAAIALGLSSSLSSAPTAAPLVTPAVVSRAYRLFIDNWKARSDWLKATMGSEVTYEQEPCDPWVQPAEEEGERPDDNIKTADPIIQNVKRARDLNEYEARLLTCVVDTANLEITFDDVCVQNKIKDSLRTIVSMPLLYPNAFKTGLLGREAIGGVLLYGPPGTGKTMMCRALARDCGARMLQLKPSDIMDCWVGESEKLTRAVFTLAFRLAPCVIFVDEMDSLFKKSSQTDRQYQRNILNEFLQSMDGLQSSKENKDKGIVVVGATNKPYDLDVAVLRRLATRMMVPLPSPEEREQILRVHLRDEQLSDDVNLHNIARETHHYSGSDLKSLCVSATMASVKDAIGDFSWTPNKSSESNAEIADQADAFDQANTPTAVNEVESKILTRTITLANFTHAISEIAPSSTTGSHAELQRWHEQFERKVTLDDLEDDDDECRVDPIINKVKEANNLNEYEQRLLHCIVDITNLETTFDHVCIPDNVKDSLRTIVSLPLMHPDAFKAGILGREASGGVLLYGPPGTGKTMLCRALAKESGARMLQLTPSDIMDCWIGQSEKLVKAVFSLAFRLAPCVIFIDEMDSLFKRSTQEDRQHQRNILNEFLQAMDGLQSAKKNKEKGIVVVGATNKPYDLDDAIIRRLATRMMVDLPGAEEREQILRIHLRDEQLDGGVDLHSIARRTRYYSGSDLKNVCVSAAMASIKDAIGNFNWTRTIPSEPKGDIPDQGEMHKGAALNIKARTMTMANFTHATNEVFASSGAGSHSKLQHWHDQFGRQRALDNNSYQKNGRPEIASHSGHTSGRYSWQQ